MLNAFFEKLKTIKHATITCDKDEKWHGTADVSITSENDHNLVFHIKGNWQNKNVSFSDTLRWTLTPDYLSLEHLRFGENNPIKLVHLVLVKDKVLKSLSPHLCGQDCYLAELSGSERGIDLTWNIQGPRKNERVTSTFF